MHRSNFCLDESAGDTFFIVFDLFDTSLGHDPAAEFTAFRTHVDDVVGTAYDIEVVFDDDDRRPLTDQGIKDIQKRFHIFRMQADRRFIKDEDGIRLLPAHLGSQLQSLRFATR